MTKQAEQTNWKALGLIGIASVNLGWFADQLLKFDNNSFFISSYLPPVMIVLYSDYIILDFNPYQFIKTEVNNFDKWRHKIFTFIVFIFIASLIFRIISLVLGIRLFDIQIEDKRLYIAISFTTILITTLADKILHWLFNKFGLLKALESKGAFFSQNTTKMLIYVTYLIVIIITNCGIKPEWIQIWINTFATYVAFERFWKFWQDQTKKVAA